MNLLLAIAALQAGEDPFPRIMERLVHDDVSVREAAALELGRLPASRIPEIAEAEARAADPELQSRLRTFILPEPWPALFAGTVDEAKALYRRAAEGGLGDPELDALVADMPASAAPKLQALATSPDPVHRRIALAGFIRFPPDRAGRLLPLLNDSGLAVRAAEAITVSGDASVLPDCLDLFGRQTHAASYVVPVLLRFPPDDLEPVARVARASPALRPAALRILRAAGPRAETALAGLLDLDGTAALEAFVDVAPDRALGVLRQRLMADPGADRLFFRLRDPVWARDILHALREDAGKKAAFPVDALAGIVGASFRDDLLAWLDRPDLKVSVRNELLPALGVVGRKEDAGRALAALEDRRLRAAAAEALGRMGDPAHAPAIAAAWLRDDPETSLTRAFRALPLEAVEEALLTVLSDPSGYGLQASTALSLADRRPTGRLRQALLKGLLDPGLDFAPHRIQALRTLAGRTQPEDLPLIRRLQASQGNDDARRIAGHLLALRGGDASAAVPLADLLAGGRYSFFDGEGSRGLVILDLASSAGAPWVKAVAAAADAKPAWIEGWIWLAEQGREGAVDALLAREKEVPEGLRRRWGRLVEDRKGDRLHRIVEEGRRDGRLTPEAEALLEAGTGPELRSRIVGWARLRVRATPHDPFVPLAVRWGDADVCRVLLERYEDEGSTLDRKLAEAMRVLSEQGVRDVRPVLHRALRSSWPVLRAGAAEALARMGDPTSIPMLVRLVDDPYALDRNRRVWDVAMEALEALTGRRPPAAATVDRRAFWREWHEASRPRDGR